MGIRNSHHCRTVAEALAALPYAPRPARPVKLAVEGNIGAGKSTFLSIMSDPVLELQDIIEVVPEPVEQWQSVPSGEGGPPINLLDRFYKDPKRYAYTFQHYVLLTRMEKVRGGGKGTAGQRAGGQPGECHGGGIRLGPGREGAGFA